MSAVFTALATSVNGYITGPDPSPDQALGRGGGRGGGGPHPTAALVVLSHRPAPANAERQTFVATGIADAIAATRRPPCTCGPSCPRPA